MTNQKERKKERECETITLDETPGSNNNNLTI